MIVPTPDTEGSAADFTARREPKTDSNGNMLPRPEGMSRQTHRRLYREACRVARIEPQFARPTNKKQRRAARKQINRVWNDKPPRGRLMGRGKGGFCAAV